MNNFIIGFKKDDFEFGTNYFGPWYYYRKTYDTKTFERWDFRYPKKNIFYVYSKNIVLLSNGIKSSIWHLYFFDNKLLPTPYICQRDFDAEENCISIYRDYDNMYFSNPRLNKRHLFDYASINNIPHRVLPKCKYRYDYHAISDEIYEKYESDFYQIKNKEYFKNEIYQNVYSLFRNQNASYEEVMDFFNKNMQQMIKTMYDSEKRHIRESEIMEKINEAITNDYLEKHYIFKNENFDETYFKLIVDEIREQIWIDNLNINDSMSIDEVKQKYLDVFSNIYRTDEMRERLYEKLDAKYTVEYVLKKYERNIKKINDIDLFEIELQNLLSSLKGSFFDYDCSEVEDIWNDEIYDCIINFIEIEKEERDFIKEYGTPYYIVEISDEKEKLFNNHKKSQLFFNHQLKKEYDTYKFLIEQYNKLYYNKRTNQLIPTMKKTDDLVNYFTGVLDIALKTNIIIDKGDIYEFQSFDNADQFIKMLHEIDIKR